ncbi:hypothetical protein ACFFWA_38850 [Actinomadura verrucosospora]|uniref:hypothetical protein n=1 Tax=Actinomadura verrucosospora TaxID=46165 RepID=UPI0031EA21B0
MTDTRDAVRFSLRGTRSQINQKTHVKDEDMAIAEVNVTLAALGFWHLAGADRAEKEAVALERARRCFPPEASLEVAPDQGIPVVDVVEVGPTILTEVNKDEETVTVLAFSGLTGAGKKEIEQTALKKARACVGEDARLEMFYCVMYENEDADGPRYETSWVNVAAVEPIRRPRLDEEVEPLLLMGVTGSTKKEVVRNALIKARADESFRRRAGADTELWVDFSEHGLQARTSAAGSSDLYVADGLKVWAVG